MANVGKELVKKVGEVVEEKIDMQMIINQALQLPAVKIDRKEFLRKELKKHYGESYVQTAIDHNPAYAGISRQAINRIAKQVINYETNKVAAISAAAAAPGGIAMVGMIPADLVQYFGFVFRIIQKLAYLYGFEELKLDEKKLDDETLNLLFVFLGIMFGVDNANAAIKVVAGIAAEAIKKQLPKKALTKGTIYPIVKKIATELGMKMTKQVFAEAVGKVGPPLLSSATSGTITYASFKIGANRLMKSFQQLNISDPNYYNYKK